MAAQLWMVGSGKGGVGKSFIASSFGITLSKIDKRVLVIDCDFEGANLHTLLGRPVSSTTLTDYWSGAKKLKECIQDSQVPRLSYIQGQWEQWSRLEISAESIQKFVRDARELNYDFVVFDMGSGATELHLEMFSHADEKFLVINPELTSIEKTYRFMESLISWQLQKKAPAEVYSNLVKVISDYRQRHRVGAFSFRDYLRHAIGFDFNYFLELDQKPVRILVNQARSQQDRDLGFAMQSVCRKYYDMPLSYIGWIDYDNAVWQSARSSKPVLLDKPFTPLAGQFLSMAKDLTQSNFVSQFLKAVV